MQVAITAEIERKSAPIDMYRVTHCSSPSALFVIENLEGSPSS